MKSIIHTEEVCIAIIKLSVKSSHDLLGVDPLKPCSFILFNKEMTPIQIEAGYWGVLVGSVQPAMLGQTKTIFLFEYISFVH